MEQFGTNLSWGLIDDLLDQKLIYKVFRFINKLFGSSFTWIELHLPSLLIWENFHISIRVLLDYERVSITWNHSFPFYGIGNSLSPLNFFLEERIWTLRSHCIMSFAVLLIVSSWCAILSSWSFILSWPHRESWSSNRLLVFRWFWGSLD